MKLAVISFSGNVGKSTIARHLLAPRLPGARVIAIESINADEGQAQSMRGFQFGELQEYLQSVEDVVVDIGASNVEELMRLMHLYHGSHEEFDCFIVPTVPPPKQQQDTIATLVDLHSVGVPTERIQVVFNMVDDREPLERTFHSVLAFLAERPIASANPACRLGANEVYARIRGTGPAAGNPSSGMRRDAAVGRLLRGPGPRALCPRGGAFSRAVAMSDPTAAREALIIEAIGEAGRLVESVDGLMSHVRQISTELAEAEATLRLSLVDFESRLLAVTEHAKTVSIKHIAAYTQDAARRSIDQQSRAMADAARLAFGAELGSSVERLRATLRPLIESQQRRWERVMSHVATAAAASVITWVMATWIAPR
jgi:hypothetical protein